MTRDATEYAQELGPHASPPDKGAEWAPSRHWFAPVPRDLNKPTLGPAVDVHLSQDRWCVMCPDCRSAQLACKTDHRFMCSECANIANGGMWLPVNWPKPSVVQQIEQLVSIRPRANRNWLPGESISHLNDENVSQGLVNLLAGG